MGDLYPTKTRLALLRDVRAWTCYRQVGDDYDYDANLGRVVTARIAELERAGWIERCAADNWRREYWRLTDAGRAVLDTHGGQQKWT